MYNLCTSISQKEYMCGCLYTLLLINSVVTFLTHNDTEKLPKNELSDRAYIVIYSKALTSTEYIYANWNW